MSAHLIIHALIPMKICDYCGRENVEAERACAGCGLELTTTPKRPRSRAEKRTIITASILGILFVAFAGSYSPVLSPATIGWFITYSAANSRSRRRQILLGAIASILLVLQLPILFVVLNEFELNGHTLQRDPAAIALIAMYVIYIISLCKYLGRCGRTSAN